MSNYYHRFLAVVIALPLAVMTVILTTPTVSFRRSKRSGHPAEVAAAERIREEALRQLDEMDLDNDDWRTEPIWALKSGLTDDNDDLDDDDDAGMMDLPPVTTPKVTSDTENGNGQIHT